MSTAPVQPTAPSLPSRWLKAAATDLFTGYTSFEKIFFAALIALQVAVSLFHFEGWLSAITAISGMICVILVGKGRISNYFFGVLQNVPYLVLSFQAFFIGEVTIAAFYVITQFWGLAIWLQAMRRARQGQAAPSVQKVAQDVQTRRLTLPWLVGVLLLLAGGSWAYSLLLTHWGSNQPQVDAFTTVIALIAQVLMVYRFREQWVGWLILNAVQIYLWSTVEGGGNIAIMAMYLGFIANSIYGWYNWTRLSKANQP